MSSQVVYIEGIVLKAKEGTAGSIVHTKGLEKLA